MKTLEAYLVERGGNEDAALKNTVFAQQVDDAAAGMINHDMSRRRTTVADSATVRKKVKLQHD